MKKLAIFFAVIAMWATKPSAADDIGTYPTRPISLVVPFAPGGGSDPLARGIGDRLSHLLGKPVVIEYKPGANAVIAEGYVSRAEPDGYTLLLDTNGLVINRILRGEDDPIFKIKPIAQPAWAPQIIVARSDFPHDNVEGLIKEMRARPGDFDYGSVGVGSASHLTGVLFDKMANTESIHVPYRGGAPAIQGLLAGDIDIFYATVPVAMSFLNSNQLKALAVTSRKRVAGLESIPTVAETIPGFEVDLWWVLMAPKDTPKPIIEVLNRAVSEVIGSSDLTARLAPQGYNFTSTSPEETQLFLENEEKKWSSLIEEVGIALD